MDPALPPPASQAPIAGLRAGLAASVLRGLAHEVANTAQTLALDPPPADAVAAARERLAGTAAILAALARDTEPSPGPSVLSEVADDVERWQSLQTEFPDIPFECGPLTGLPALATGHAEARAMLLGLITDAKRGGARRIRMQAARDGDSVRCDLEHADVPPPAAELADFAASLGAALSTPAPGHRVIRFPAAVPLR